MQDGVYQELRPLQARGREEDRPAEEGHEHELPAPLDRRQHARDLVLSRRERTAVLRHRIPHGLLRRQAVQPEGRVRHLQGILQVRPFTTQALTEIFVNLLGFFTGPIPSTRSTTSTSSSPTTPGRTRTGVSSSPSRERSAEGSFVSCCRS